MSYASSPNETHQRNSQTKKQMQLQKQTQPQPLSLFVPHVFLNHTEKFVINVFDRLNIGSVSRVDFVRKMGKGNVPFNTMYVHFEEWYDNIVATNFKNNVLNPDKEARLVYDDPWYWIVCENKTQKAVPGGRKIRINLDELFAAAAEKKAGADGKNGSVIDGNNTEVVCDSVPRAPPSSPTAYYSCPDAYGYTEDDYAKMDELDELEYSDNASLVTIDGRYIEELEAENIRSREIIAMYQQYIYNININANANMLGGNQPLPAFIRVN